MVEQLKVAAPVLTKEGGAMAKAFEGAKPPSHECFNCGGEMHRIKGKNGFSGAARTRLARRRSQTTEETRETYRGGGLSRLPRLR